MHRAGTAPTPEEEVLAAYAADWKAVRDAFAPPAPNPDLPALREHTTGEVLRYAIENAKRAVQDNEAYVVPDNDASNHRVEVLSIRENGAWKTSVLRREADWEGVAGCALEDG